MVRRQAISARRVLAAGLTLAVLLGGAPPAALAREQASPLLIPAARLHEPLRNITTDDLARLRDIDTLSVSPDGDRYAILVRQAVPEANAYRTAWFVGDLSGTALTYVGDGGAERLLTRPGGNQTGDIGASVSRWSPDGRFIAYTVLRDGAVQLWTSRVDGRGQRQITHNASDVRDFAWTADGRRLLFTVGVRRDELAARAEAHARRGYRLQEFSTLFRAINAAAPLTPLDTELTTWSVAVNARDERVATPAERAEYAAASERQYSARKAGVEVDAQRLSAAARPPVVRADGAYAWLERIDPTQDGAMPNVRLHASLHQEAAPAECADERCTGHTFKGLWWSAEGNEVLFWRVDGPADFNHSLYAWNVSTGEVRTIVSAADHVLSACERATRHLICLRETPLEPRHVVAFDIATGAPRKISDVNPEMARFRLGRVERIEWDTAPVAGEHYAPRSHGFILYPPDYDPNRSYPLFVAPYSAGGFLRGDVGDEHPLLVYAANGFIVLNSAFPNMSRMFARADPGALRRSYEPALNHPHLSAFAETTFDGIDLTLTRARIDPTRIGIGGLSHGAFVPLFMLQRRDRFAALSVAGGSWSSAEYYFARLPEPYGEHTAPTWPEAPEFWAPIDLAQNLEQIEAPVLFHIADSEVISAAVLLRRMSDARLAFEAYSFNDEKHMKWQPAHRLSIYNRNLDWFRFWLQDIADPDPAKAEQYQRWRQLRDLQCHNPRSLRNHCGVASTEVAPAR